MPGAEIANIRGSWESGNLVLQNVNGVNILSVGVPTTGLRAIPAGNVSVVTTSATLTSAMVGQVLYALATTTITLTLPAAGSTAAHSQYTIVNGGSTGSVEIIVLSGITTEILVGCGWATSAAVYQITNTQTTSATGDAVQITAGGSTTSIWWLTGLVGTWVSTT